ncbi:MAG: hypothetical protein ABIN48_10090 [Ginsengibacter sp.]
MNKYSRILPVLLLFCGVCFLASADRGRFVTKKKITLDFNPADNLRNATAFNLKSGILYKGSDILKQEIVGNSLFSDLIVSYKKGNTIYILPYKQRISIPEYSKDEGSKLIIRLKK